MRLIDLTMPIFEGMGIGNCYPQDSPFTLERALPDLGFFRLSMSTEPGTRHTVNPALAEDVEKEDLNKIMFRDTVIVDIPKGTDESITAEEIESAFAKADYRKGDIVIIRTGWGSPERLEKLGDDYQWRSPNLLPAGATKLAELMKSKNSDIFGFDMSGMNTFADTKPGWSALGSPNRWAKNWDHEKKDFTPEVRKFLPIQAENRRKNPPCTAVFAKAGISTLGGLVNVTSIKKERVKLIILPLKLRGLHTSPARIVAIEE